MRRLDAYARISPGEAARLAMGAIAGIMAERRMRAERAVEAYRRRASAPKWWRWRRRRPECTTEEARRRLETLCREKEWIYLEDLEYDYWQATNSLHSDALRAAKALSEAAGPAEASGARLGGWGILVNPEDLLELRTWADLAPAREARCAI